MRVTALAVAALIAGAASSAAAQDRPPAYTNAEACLEANVEGAVAASSGAADAAHFLLDFLCAEPVSYARAYQRNSAALEGVKAMMSTFAMTDAEGALDAAAVMDGQVAPTGEQVETWDVGSPFDDYARAFDGIGVDPVTGAVVVSPDVDTAMGNAMASLITNQMAQLGPMADDEVPVFLRQMAGRLVMDHRRR